MNLTEFMAEAERLARPSTILKPNGRGEPVAYWHGLRFGKPCISLRHRDAWLTLHVDITAGHVELSDSPLRSTTPLFAEAVTSLPPIDGVFLRGSEAIDDYLRRHDWTRANPYNDNFPDDVPGHYERLWQANCPIYSREVVAACGGWHFPWPDGDFPELIDSELVVWTLHDSEPWVEVFARGDVLTVLPRIT